MTDAKRAYASWPGNGYLACWVYRPRVIDAIVLANDEGRLAGFFVPYAFTPNAPIPRGR